MLHSNLNFANSARSGSGDLMAKLNIIAKRFDGITRSFEYIGDYVNSNGLKVSSITCYLKSQFKFMHLLINFPDLP